VARARLDDARPRFRAVDAAWELWDRDRSKAATLLAGALVYRLFVWLLPVALLVASLLGFLAQHDSEDPAELARDGGMGSYLVSVVGDAAAQAKGSRWITLILALFGLAVAGSGTVRALRLSHALIWDVELPKLRRAWVGPIALLGVTILVGSLGALSWKFNDLGPGVGIGFVLASSAAVGAGWLLASWLLPHGDAPWWALVPGAVAWALGVLGIHLFTAYYLTGKLQSASEMYGSFGAAAAVLLWLSILARLIMLAAGLNATLWHRRVRRRAAAGSHIAPPRRHDASGATFTVWRFATPGGAGLAQETLRDLQRQGLIVVHDAATVSWAAGARKPTTRQLPGLTEAGALGGAFWGLLFGVVFLVPLLGVAVGAAAGALGSSLRDVGIDDEFIAAVRREVRPGTSALFVLSSDAVIARVREAFEGQHPELVHTNLSTGQEDRLREVFGS
jgi:uncharacterized membrane protein/uncharacterized BrkB/YihY/UPF0761 family membrane protein